MKKSPRENRNSVYVGYQCKPGQPRLAQKAKTMGLYPPHACEKIKDIHQGKKCIFNLAARTRNAIHMNRNKQTK